MVFINIIAGCRPWVKATFADLNFRSFVLDPSYLRQILPLSEDAAEIIQGMLDPEPATRMGKKSRQTGIRSRSCWFHVGIIVRRAHAGFGSNGKLQHLPSRMGQTALEDGLEDGGP